MGLLCNFWLSLSQVLKALGLDLFKITVLPVTLLILLLVPTLILVDITVYDGVKNAIFCSLSLFYEWRLVYSERLVAAFSGSMWWGQVSYLTVKFRDCFFVYRNFPWCVQLWIKLQKHGWCKGEGEISWNPIWILQEDITCQTSNWAWRW